MTCRKQTHNLVIKKFCFVVIHSWRITFYKLRHVSLIWYTNFQISPFMQSYLASHLGLTYKTTCLHAYYMFLKWNHDLIIRKTLTFPDIFNFVFKWANIFARTMRWKSIAILTFIFSWTNFLLLIIICWINFSNFHL